MPAGCDMSAQLLVVWHSRTGFAKEMSRAVARGASEAARQMGSESHFKVVRRRAIETLPSHLRRSAGFVFVAPENLASVSGEFKEFFDRSYYHMFGECETEPLLLGRPYGIAIAAGSDGSGAARQLARFCTGWRLEQVAPEAVICRNGLPQTRDNILRLGKDKLLTAEQREECELLGGTVAGSILLGMEGDS